jgi:hypothetical protein
MNCECCGESIDGPGFDRSKSPGGHGTGMASDNVCFTCYVRCSPASPAFSGADSACGSVFSPGFVCWKKREGLLAGRRSLPDGWPTGNDIGATLAEALRQHRAEDWWSVRTVEGTTYLLIFPENRSESYTFRIEQCSRIPAEPAKP